MVLPIEVEKYLKKIERELSEIDPKLRKSIVQEIKEHLEDKIEDIKRSSKVSELTPGKIKTILKDFGEPEEIARDYKRQLSEAQLFVSKKKKKAAKMIAVGISIFIIIALILIPVYYLYLYQGAPIGLEDKTILPGKGLDQIQLGDDLDRIEEVLGESEERVDSDTTLWVVYKKEYGLDFLLIKSTKTIIEIRFNPGFDGALENGITIGTSLDEVLNITGGAKKTVQTNLTETHGVLLGSDKVLYEQIIDGNVTAYKFIDAENGILFWFDVDKMVTQIVVFRPY
ncbi:MAG: hypothetical protein KAJ51_07200 [Thermoplasmata archaeon]|nr:hypothetical protein [Thermoplasmata archaeon]